MKDRKLIVETTDYTNNQNTPRMKTIFRLFLCLIAPTILFNWDKFLGLSRAEEALAFLFFSFAAVIFGVVVSLVNLPRSKDTEQDTLRRGFYRFFGYVVTVLGSFSLTMTFHLGDWNLQAITTELVRSASSGYLFVAAWMALVAGVSFVSRLMQNGYEHDRKTVGKVCSVGLLICAIFFAFWPIAIAGKESFMEGQFHTIQAWTSFVLVTFILAVAPLMAGRLLGKHSQMIA